MSKYFLNLRDEQSCTHTVELDADSNVQAVEIANATAQSEADYWCSFGEWGDDGASVDVWWELTDADDEELDSGFVTVEIEPDHSSKIADAVGRWDRPDNFCGDDPEDHDWTSEGEGGCDENPGVWSTGRTSMVFKSHCRKCGLHRTETTTGSQRNPGEHDTVEYEMLDSDAIDRLRDAGHMDDAE